MMQGSNKQDLTPLNDKVSQRKLGKSGLSVSEVGLGCWQLGGDFGPIDNQRVNTILDAADSSGITFWDTADVYGGGESERRIGNWCQSHKHQQVIATKLGRNESLYPNGYSVDNIRRSVDDSLARLQLSSLPLIQLHCIPPDMLANDSIWNCLEDMKKERLIDNIAASVETIAQANTCLDVPSVSSLQIILNIFRQDACDSLLAKAQKADVGILARLPLASGLLTGKMHKNTQFADSDHRNYNRDGAAFSVGETFSGIPYIKALDLVEELKALVPADMNMAQFALRWCLDQQGVSSVLAGASSPEQVFSNAHASQLAPLSSETHVALKEFYDKRVRPHVRGEI